MVITGDDRVAQPGTGALSLTGHEPTVVLTEDHFVQPPAGSLTLEGIEPFLADGVAYRYPGTGVLTLTGHEPTLLLTNNLEVEPGLGSLTITGLAPTLALTASGEIAVPVGALVLTGLAPTVSVSGTGPTLTNLNDAIRQTTGGTTIQDGLASWFSQAPGEAIEDAERRWLLALPATSSGTNQDLWRQYLESLGYSGSLNDMWLQYWINGGT